jgi:hypothetical protein
LTANTGFVSGKERKEDVIAMGICKARKEGVGT